MANYEDKVMLIVADQLGHSIDNISSESTFDNLGADSLDITEIVIEVEGEFDISFTEDQIDKVGSVGKLVAFVEDKVIMKIGDLD